MDTRWTRNILLSRQFVHTGGQTDLAIIVSGNENDRQFWHAATTEVIPDILRRDGRVRIISVSENHPRGSFLGTLAACCEAAPQLGNGPTNGVSLISMVFGKGRRLSPFTQALGNRKAAFPTPLRGTRSGAYLRTGDVAILYSSLWMEHLRASGFNGILVKWGDEAIVPSSAWTSIPHDFRDVDLVRFVWRTQPTEVLAAEKEWFILNQDTGLIERLLPRQTLPSLHAALRDYSGRRYATAVNLGSVAVSHSFLKLAVQALQALLGRDDTSADWDPYVTALLISMDAATCGNQGLPADPAIGAWRSQAEHRCPGLSDVITQLRAAVTRDLGRPPRVAFLDFGEAFWVDFGLHKTLRQTFEALVADSERGWATRTLFDIPHERDRNGNIIVRSAVPAAARITNSLILDSTILDPDSVVDRGIVVCSRHRTLMMPSGGVSLFSAVQDLRFDGEHGVAFRSVAADLVIPPGGRHTSLFLSHDPESLVSNESVQNYDATEYSRPILGNRMSFEEAGLLAEQLDPVLLEQRWKTAWSARLL